jgi:hypothetical protein
MAKDTADRQDLTRDPLAEVAAVSAALQSLPVSDKIRGLAKADREERGKLRDLQRKVQFLALGLGVNGTPENVQALVGAQEAMRRQETAVSAARNRLVLAQTKAEAAVVAHVAAHLPELRRLLGEAAEIANALAECMGLGNEAVKEQTGRPHFHLKEWALVLAAARALHAFKERLKEET